MRRRRGLGTGLGAVSTTAITVQLGEAVFALSNTWAPVAGTVISARRAADPTTYLIGAVTASGAGSVTMNAELIGGAGTFSDWVLAYVAGEGSARLEDDPAPKLAADLDADGNAITGASSVSTDALTIGGLPAKSFAVTVSTALAHTL